MEMPQLVVTQQALSRYHGNAIWCIDHVTKESLICHNTFSCSFKHTVEDDHALRHTSSALTHLIVPFTVFNIRLQFIT
jgi:hypothetical protein